MKRIFRVIIPLILILAVLASAFWYLFVYDREFTNDILLKGARFFEESGSPNISTWLYDLAYQHSSHAPEIAIELARQYKSDENYSKAEYTLTKAIAQTSAPELYVELCATFVEQDKLLDAVTLLDTISDPIVREVLDAQRPAAPVFTPQPTFYSQYIHVGIQESEHSVYLSIGKEYPSTTVEYTAPISLPAGQTTVQALAIGPTKLVSKLAIGNYTIGGIVERVDFADQTIESMVRTELMVAGDTELYTNDLWNILEFTVPKEVTNCEDLALLTKLQSLTIESPTETDLSFLSNLSDLEHLSISGSKLDAAEIDAIGSLTELTDLTLTNCGISNITSFKALSKLERLDISHNTVRNIDALTGMTAMSELNLSSNAITDIQSLSAMTHLKELNLSHNSVSSLQPISSSRDLYILDASFNQVSDILPVGSLIHLNTLNISNNTLLDISAIAPCTALTYLDVSNNTLTAIDVVGQLTQIQKLYFSYNQVETLPEFSSDSQLMTIDASYNKISALDPLAGLSKLNDVFVDYNENLKSLQPLDECPLLVLVNAYGTLVTDISFLTDKSVLVNYDPTI